MTSGDYYRMPFSRSISRIIMPLMRDTLRTEERGTDAISVTMIDTTPAPGLNVLRSGSEMALGCDRFIVVVCLVRI